MKGTSARRTVATVAAFASAALIMSGCAGASPEPSAPPALELSTEPVTLNITWWGSDSRAELTNAAIAAFEAEYPNITVEGEYKDFATYWDGLATATAAGDAPDVIQMDELFLASYGQRGALLDLGTASNLLPTDDFSADALATGQVDGVQYAIPTGVSAYAMFANKDIFDQYGVDLPDDSSWTWDDLADIADEISEKSGGAVFGAGNIGGFDIGSVKYWARSDGSNVFDEDGKVTLDPQALVDMWNFNMDLQESGGGTPASTLVEQFAGGINASGLATNTAALQTNYNTQITGLQTASGQNLGCSNCPRPATASPIR